MQVNKNQIEGFFKDLQDQICSALEGIDGKSKFHEDLWQRPQGGGGRTRIIQNGKVFEKGGVNFSAVHGKLPANIKKALGVEKDQFYACGISIVMHPQNVHVPIIHMNTRYFEIESETYWFGGGIDLTPHYIYEDQARFFHQSLKNACDKHSTAYYTKFKKWADDYFYIKHRKETRGVGGIFFDRLNDADGFTKNQRFEFVKDVGQAFVPTYSHLVELNKDKSFSEEQKTWQGLRRGRYVEFNLVYDKGTKFGLDTDGRIESILMSLPQQARWHYNVQTKAGSEESKTLGLLKKDIDWINM